MAVLLIDTNLEGHAKLLDKRLNTETWRELRVQLDVTFLYFDQAGIDRNATDDVVWRICQENRYFLLTANRNLEADNSLEATIRREGTADSLPVFTVADADRMLQSAEYRDNVAESLLEYILDEDRIRGSGRLYLP